MGTNKDQDDDESDDPFACFDSSDDEEDDDGDDGDASGQADQQQIKIQNEEQNRRDPGNGVLAFHAGTEIALFHHVQTQLSTMKAAPAADVDVDTDVTRAMIRNAQTVLDLVDSYCLSRHWMMHVGPEKATPLRKFIGDCLAETGRTTDGSNSAFTFVELGTYCGYSSIFFAKTMLEHDWNHGKTTATTTATATTSTTTTTTSVEDALSFHIYSVEVVEKFAAVAKELIRLAGMEAYITVILMTDPDARAKGSSLSSELKSRLPDASNDHGAETATIDFLFVDHDKSMYLPHLQELEETGMIRTGTHVAADNVVFAEIDEYRHYMADLASKGIVATRLEDALMVEYCQPELLVQQQEDASTSVAITKDMLRDGIEFSVYLKDPR